MKIIALAMLIFAIFSSVQATEGKTAIIYKNEACGHCTPYLEKLLPILKEKGYAPEIKDFINFPETRIELASLQEKFGVPLQYQGHMLVFLDGKYLFEGHVPVNAISEFLNSPSNDPIIVYQDSMNDENKYFVIKDGNAAECSIPTLVSQCSPASSRSSSLPLFPNWAFPLIIFAVPVGFIAKYGIK